MRRLPIGALYALPLIFLAIFYLYPLLAILRVSFGAGDITAQISSAVMSAAFWRLLWFTTWQAALSTVLTVLAGLPLAYIFARFDFPESASCTRC